MVEKVYQNYTFAKHKGYGTKVHRTEIVEFGMCEIHRRSFKCFSIKDKGLFDD